LLCYEKNVMTIRQVTFFLRYDNNVMTIWKMLINVCNRSTDGQLTLSRTYDDRLKTFDYIQFYTICNTN